MSPAQTPFDGEQLRRDAVRTDGGLLLVGEPAAKAMLRGAGLRVPNSVTLAPGEDVVARCSVLRPPFVVKAFGPGIVHKTELGAVRLGVGPEDLVTAAREFTDRLAGLMGATGGLLIEEQLQPGAEILVGLVRRSGVPLVICGLGGVLAEAANVVAVRLAPLRMKDAHSMVAELEETAAFASARIPIQRAELVDLLLGISGNEGIFGALCSAGLAEFECNPVIVTADGLVIADARLLLEETVDRAPPAAHRDFSAMFHPESIALAGVSASGKGMGSLALEAYRRLGWTDGLSVVHPSAERFGNTPAVRTLADLPGGSVDYLKVVLPAALAVDFVAKEGHRAKVVQVISDGFGAAGPSGRPLADELLEAARAAGTPVIGPNCIGCYCPQGRQTYELAMPPRAGTTGFVSQSGGMSTDVIRVGYSKGLRFSKVCSVGNGIDVSPAEMLEYLVGDPETAVIGAYLEGISDPRRLVRALETAQGRVPVALLVSGQSPSGAAAAKTHSGAMAGDARLLAAIAGSTGTTMVSTMDELLAALVGLDRYVDRPSTGPPAVLVAGHGGGHTVVVGDACERAGLKMSSLEPAVIYELVAHPLGVQKSLVNPIELPIGPIRPPESMRAVLGVICAGQPFSDVLLHFTARSFYSEDYFGYGGQITPLLDRLESLRDPLPGSPRVYAIARSLEVIPRADRERFDATAASVGIPCFGRIEDAVTAIRAVQSFDRHRRGDDARSLSTA